MVKCVVQCCKNDTRKHTKKKFNITFHRFPKDENLTKKWIEAIKKSDWEPTIWSKICSIHFQDSSIYETKNGLQKIADNAVPSRFLDNPPTSSQTPINTEPLNSNASTSDKTEAPKKRSLRQEVTRLRDLAKRRRLRCNAVYAALRRLRKKLYNMTRLLKELKTQRIEQQE